MASPMHQLRRGETPMRTSTVERRMLGSPSVSSLSSRSTLRDSFHGVGVEDDGSSYSRNGNSVPGSVITNESSYSVEDTTAEDDPGKRQMNLIKVYSEGNVRLKNEATMKSLTRAVRRKIIPHLKFIKGTKQFGSFDQPDFSDANCWVNKIFAEIPTLNQASDRVKGEIWMTYKAKIKDQFTQHRSSVTLKIKRKFLKGKYFLFGYNIFQMLCLTKCVTVLRNFRKCEYRGEEGVLCGW